jgi:hypothetical protein
MGGLGFASEMGYTAASLADFKTIPVLRGGIWEDT